MAGRALGHARWNIRAGRDRAMQFTNGDSRKIMQKERSADRYTMGVMRYRVVNLCQEYSRTCPAGQLTPASTTRISTWSKTAAVWTIPKPRLSKSAWLRQLAVPMRATNDSFCTPLVACIA
jgi:hypothetical protein